MRVLLPVVAALTLGSSASAAAVWAGVNATTAGYGVHAGTALLPVPFIGTLGLEGSAEFPWSANASTSSRYAAGVTLRDLNIPLSRVDAFASLGGQLTVPTAIPGGSTQNQFALYGEAGLRGPVLGPAGWRAFVRASSAGQLGAGVGLELRF
ncbi:hypothetical protein GO986_20285 [Deinococcus sp. HMF7620]|uniref:Outer membrane protein beta-barrel domain-containing protein n=1 Tax=Deinococcus arboris TaxID=2682977 RepID=A0A7C9MBE8_9DEIO|nr:hypothetical protein [Deinococcus arboris]MVN89083.1 hypothetical protein [Deinococcus arboris]